MTDDCIIEAIVKIANHEKVIKELEPHVAFPMKVEAWQVKRILKAQELLQNEWDKLRKTNTKRTRPIPSEE
jgi:hypothetical protein